MPNKIEMGPKKEIKARKAILPLIMLMLFGTNLLFAQDATTDNASGPVDWLGIGYYVLIFIVGCFGVAILGKILKVYDLSQKMQGKRGLNWSGVNGVICLIFLIAGFYGAYWSFTNQGTMTLPESASAHGVDIDNMFLVTTILTLIVFVITQACLFGFAFAYRGSEKRKAHYLPHNDLIEKIWTVIPAIVLTILVVFGFFTWQRVMNSDPAKGDLNIDVTGHQFAWYLRYPGKDGKLGDFSYKLVNGQNSLGLDFTDKKSLDDLSADTLVLPVNRTIRLNIHAQDVIHSVYMPHFRVQLNAVPGLPTFFKFVPTITTAQMRAKVDDPKFEYLLYCNKICGGGHYNMQKVVRVVTQEEYEEWIARQKPFLTDQLKNSLKLAQVKEDNNKKVSNRLALNN
jgi:cytochrome c oxidase subunit II